MFYETCSSLSHECSWSCCGDGGLFLLMQDRASTPQTCPVHPVIAALEKPYTGPAYTLTWKDINDALYAEDIPKIIHGTNTEFVCWALYTAMAKKIQEPVAGFALYHLFKGTNFAPTGETNLVFSGTDAYIPAIYEHVRLLFEEKNYYMTLYWLKLLEEKGENTSCLVKKVYEQARDEVEKTVFQNTYEKELKNMNPLKMFSPLSLDITFSQNVDCKIIPLNLSK